MAVLGLRSPEISDNINYLNTLIQLAKHPILKENYKTKNEIKTEMWKSSFSVSYGYGYFSAEDLWL